MRVLLLVAAALAACWPTLSGLHERWTDADQKTYTHGYLVAAICVFLLWRRNVGGPDQGVQRRGGVLPFVLLGGAAVGWVLVVRAGIGIVEWMALPVILILAIWAAFGPAVARRNLFPIGYLYFAIPIWGSVNGLFQSATVVAVRGLLRVVGVPSHFNGNFVEIPAGTFEIAGGCSGLHFVIVALALAALMGEMRGDDWRGRSILLVLAGALAVVTNWIRVFVIIVAGHQTDMQHYLVAQSHYGFGWVLFALAMVVFFLAERRIDVREPRRRQAAPPLRSAPTAMPAWGALIVLLLMGGLQYASARAAPERSLESVAAAGWSNDTSPPDWLPHIEGADVASGHSYVAPGQSPVQRFEFLFRWQRQDKELGGYGNDLLFAHRGQVSTRERLGGLPVVLHEARDVRGSMWLVAEAYRVGGHYDATASAAQLRYAVDSIKRLHSVPSSILVWRTECLPDCAQARERLATFISGTERRP